MNRPSIATMCLIATCLVVGCGPYSYYDLVWDEASFQQAQAAATAHLAEPAQESAQDDPFSAPRSYSEPVVLSTPAPPVAPRAIPPFLQAACTLDPESPLAAAETKVWDLAAPEEDFGPFSIAVADGSVVGFTDAVGEERDILDGGRICEDVAGQPRTSFTTIVSLQADNAGVVEYTFDLEFEPVDSRDYIVRVQVSHRGRVLYTWTDITLTTHRSGGGGGGGYWIVVYY